MPKKVPVQPATNLLLVKRVARWESQGMKSGASKIGRTLQGQVVTSSLHQKKLPAYPLLLNMNSSIKRLTFQVRDNTSYPAKKKKEEQLLAGRTGSQPSPQERKNSQDQVLMSGFVLRVPTSPSPMLLGCRTKLQKISSDVHLISIQLASTTSEVSLRELQAKVLL